MTRSKVAAKYVNLVDRVPDVAVRQGSYPLIPVIRPVRADVPMHVKRAFVADLKALFAGAASEFDDRTLADLVGTGLLGE